MKAITVSELKAQLSKYLRIASRGTVIIVKDRDDPVAQIGPLQSTPASWRDRMAREGRLKLGSQNWGELRISKLPRQIDIQEVLRSVRDDAGEVRRR